MLTHSNMAVIVPVYNHGTRIGDVLRKTVALGYPVFVVDDGSTDNTAEILSGQKGITVLTHSHNRGKGEALQTGFKAAAQSAQWVITLDADGQHKPEDLETFFKIVQGGERPIVVGVRQGMDGAHVPLTSRFGRGFSNFWVWASGGPRIKDSQSGFRLYPLPETLALDVKASRYQYEVEVLVLAHRNGIPVLQTPVQVVYQKGAERISHFRPWKDFFRNAGTFSRLICQRIFTMGKRT